jgi:F1F0 ATPase subunit 2
MTTLAAVPLATAALHALLGAATGGATGYCYFVALRWSVDLFERREPAKAALLALFRFAALAAVFVALAKCGAFALLAGLAGLLVARRMVMRRFEEAE